MLLALCDCISFSPDNTKIISKSKLFFGMIQCVNERKDLGNGGAVRRCRAVSVSVPVSGWCGSQIRKFVNPYQFDSFHTKVDQIFIIGRTE